MNKQVWVALDVPDRETAETWMARLSPHRHFKVGLELFTAVGPEAVSSWTKEGAAIFLDLKLHDIPNTVAGAVSSVRKLGVSLLTVHAASGPPALAKAQEAAEEALTLAAVTVLTSLNGEDLDRLGVPRAGEWTLTLAGVAAAAGVPAVVCAASEAASVKAHFPQLVTVVPGIRAAGAAQHDQARVATPGWAASHGADHLVVGRAVLASGDPQRALREICEEVERAG
jgi:orotidine-5'-phosphate decarboxylase